MEEKKLNYFKHRLLKEKANLKRTLRNSHYFNFDDSLTNSLGELSAYDNHPGELASETFEREKDLALLKNQEEFLQKIDEALEHMKTGDYGICEGCGVEINPERLEALPYTTFCIECQEKLEEDTIDHLRPIEEELLTPPFGRTFLDETDNIATDGEDIWQEVAKYGTSETPSDLGGVLDYNEVYLDAKEPLGIVTPVEAIIDVGPDEIPEAPGNYDQRD